MAQSLGTELGKAIGTSLKESSDYKQDFFETEMLGNLQLVPLESINLRTSLFINKQEIGNHFVLDHPVNGNLDFRSGLVAFYTLDGEATDHTVLNHDGTVSGALVSASSMKGSSYYFDGADDYIELADSTYLRLTSGGTIMAWIYPISLGESSFGRIVDKSTTTSATNGYLFSMATNNRLELDINGSTIMLTPTNAISLNTWQHVAVTFNGTTARMFVNGSNVASSTSAALPPNVSGIVRIGTRASATDRSYYGYIDELSIWSRALATSEISEIYNSGVVNRSLIGFEIDGGLGTRTLFSSSEVQI